MGGNTLVFRLDRLASDLVKVHHPNLGLDADLEVVIIYNGLGVDVSSKYALIPDEWTVIARDSIVNIHEINVGTLGVTQSVEISDGAERVNYEGP